MYISPANTNVLAKGIDTPLQHRCLLVTGRWPRQREDDDRKQITFPLLICDSRVFLTITDLIILFLPSLAP